MSISNETCDKNNKLDWNFNNGLDSNEKEKLCVVYEIKFELWKLKVRCDTCKNLNNLKESIDIWSLKKTSDNMPNIEPKFRPKIISNHNPDLVVSDKEDVRGVIKRSKEEIKKYAKLWIDIVNWDKIKYDPVFQKRLEEVAKEIWANPADLRCIIDAESRYDTTATSIHSNAKWLIQFLPSTARDLWTSTKELAQMSWVNQLEFVIKYFNQFKKPFTSLTDLYLAVFFPIARWKWPNYILWSNEKRRQNIAKQNKKSIGKYSDHPKGYIDNRAFAKYIEATKRKT